MMSVLSGALDWLALHPWAAIVAVFLLALSESLPVIGAIVPGTAAILAIAALVPSGVAGPWPLLAAASAGAILSDGVAYGLGRRHHRAILGRWPLNRHPAVLARSEAFFRRHGGKSVFLARFVPGVRAFIPLTAGMLEMPAARFYAANILSAGVWAVTHIMPGIAVGGYIQAGHGAFGRLVLPASCVVAAVAVMICVGRHLRRRPSPIGLGNGSRT